MKRESKPKRIVPSFASQAEEAEWWYRNRRKLDKELLAAARSGQLKTLKRKNLAARIARSKAAKVISIRMAESDLEMARSQAARQGLPYQTYIKSLLHQALAQQAKNR
jgi:predicted DNA binding CopG/RHH family protein